MKALGLITSLICCNINRADAKNVPKMVEPPTVANSNFTRRPLNLYITANAVHAKVEQKEWNAIRYEEVVPPFLIKRRGSILLLHKNNDKFHLTERPSLFQELAASGHRSISLDVETLKTVNPNELIRFFNLTNCVLLLQNLDASADDLVSKLIDAFGADLDAVILEQPSFILRNDSIKAIYLQNRETTLNIPAGKNTQIIQISEGQHAGPNQIMQVVANFLDFIHPR